MAGANGHCQRIAARTFHKFSGFFRIGEFGIGLGHGDVLLYAAQLPKLSFHHNPSGMRGVHYPAGGGNVIFEIFTAGIDHDRGVKTAVDAVVTGFFVAMVQVHGKNGIRKDLISRTDETFQHNFVGVRARTLADLNNERRFAVQVSAEQSHELFKIVDVVGADGIFAVGGFE